VTSETVHEASHRAGGGGARSRTWLAARQTIATGLDTFDPDQRTAIFTFAVRISEVL